MRYITPEITDEMIKKSNTEKSKQILATISKAVVKMKFGNGQQDIITYQTSRARQISLTDKIALMLLSC